MTMLIVEDEARSARLLQKIIESVRPDGRVIGICSSIEETISFLNAHSPDLIFMDIELADGNSFAIFKQVSVKSPVVFCTAHDEYMLEAFRTTGIDYLLKPVDEKAIQLVFSKIDTITKALAPDVSTLARLLTTAQPSSQYNSSFLVRFREKMMPVAVSDIAAISFENEVCCLYTFKQEKHTLFKTMDDVEEALDPAHFFRISRQMIIGRRAIVDIEQYFNRKVILTLSCKTAEQPIVSRLKVTPFLSWVEKD